MSKTCDECGAIFPDDWPEPIRCNHKGIDFTATDPRPTSKYIRRQLCTNCKYRTKKGCALYLKPCTVKLLWNDQIDPPTQCPKKEQFYE